MRIAFRARTAAATIASTLLALPVRAGSILDQTGLNETGTASGIGKPGSNDIASIVGSVIGALLGLAGIVLVLLIIYAGYLWMTAQGDDKKVDEAKQIIKNAVIGTVLMFSAYVIANTIANFVATGIGG